MFGRVITMVAGRSIARTVGGAASGPAGLVVGALLPTVLRRLGPGGMIAAAVGGMVVRRAMKGVAERRI
ncbi:MAG: hypothetical protein H7243_06655 [Sphingomonadaceae bacterium]|nr:hypothetical protein [Sphingomonadaceae bacterium]